MSARGAIAEKLFREKKYNCAQAVACAFADVTKIDEDTMKHLACGFGGGVGKMREICGALSGAVLILDLLYAPDDPADREKKAEHYALIQKYDARFREAVGQAKTDMGEAIPASHNCRTLLGPLAELGHIPAERTQAYYDVRPCPHIVRIAADVLDEMIGE